MLVDSHCHLELIEEKGIKIIDIIEMAKIANVHYLQTICTKISEFKKILSLTKLANNIFGSVGVHPNNVKEEGIVSFDKLIELSKEEKIIGIGETGLDYYYGEKNDKKQQESFINHINVCQESGLPLIVHSRDADEDMMKILESEMKKKYFSGLMHCFSSSKELAIKTIDLGFYISISGIITFKNNHSLADIVKNDVPLDRMLIETDSPYLAPTPHRGKINHPALVKYVAEKIAELKNIEFSKVAKITTDNFFELFKKAKRNN